MSGAACPVETRRAAPLLIRDEMGMGALLLGREEQHYCEVEQDDRIIVGKCCWQQLDSATFRSLITAAEKLPLLLLLVGQHLKIFRVLHFNKFRGSSSAVCICAFGVFLILGGALMVFMGYYVMHDSPFWTWAAERRKRPPPIQVAGPLLFISGAVLLLGAILYSIIPSSFFKMYLHHTRRHDEPVRVTTTATTRQRGEQALRCSTEWNDKEQHYCDVEQDDRMIAGKCCWQQLDSTTFRRRRLASRWRRRREVQGGDDQQAAVEEDLWGPATPSSRWACAQEVDSVIYCFGIGVRICVRALWAIWIYVILLRTRLHGDLA
ncbi:hypothetical protein Q1695_015372 [Nippostrongylus brasiliensis]|nr:hypothetical protein Q1695_015372 [Nippostrongylus brasiliensis]